MVNELLEKIPQKASRSGPCLSGSSLRFEPILVDGYEEVLKVVDDQVGLTAIISIHNTSLGPALGGVRIQPYASFHEALDDVLRLSKGMTFKSAIAEAGFGGGKSVIIADPKTQKTPDLLLAFGEAVERLKGRYICAEDAGCSVQDVKQIRRATQYVVGLPNEMSSGDPSSFTAWGVFRGIQSAAKKLFGTDSLEGKKIAIQGLGNVGSRLAEFLFWAGADLTVFDLDSDKTNAYAKKYRAKAVDAVGILKTECDIFAPCALGGGINDRTLPLLRCAAIAGAANNQLRNDWHAEALKEKGILYAPDFVINAGGLLNVASELEPDGYHPVRSRERVHRIYDTLAAVYEIADSNGQSTHSAALALAEHRIRYGISKRSSPPVFHHKPE